MASRLGTVETVEFYVKLGGAVGDVGEIKFGFVAPKKAYEGIKDELGVIQIGEDQSARGVVFGANRPTPPRVRITYKKNEGGRGSTRSRGGSTVRYCDPDKVGRVLNGSLRDAPINVAGTDFEVKAVSMA
ncbi:MAG: hypothetical protein F6J97_22435 [Leptolyngbya sp. SIO4C1]|nr:hypothetical protein [Leptolyngbya sp. SIO4C1]